MPLIGALVLLIQFSFAIHALKTRRPSWWLFVIMAFPVMGCIIYYFVEVFPGSREHRTAHKTTRKLIKKLQPDADLKKRAEELEICGSVDNKIALAEECFEHGMFAEAASLYESCMQGLFASDGVVLYGLAEASVEGENWDKADQAISKLTADAPKFRPFEVRLLAARLLQGRGQTDAALAAYRQLIPEFVGLEARFRYGELLAKLENHEAALHIFNDIIQHAKRHASTIEHDEQWVEAARKAIAPAKG